jgi:hypothetical protein
LRRRGLQNHIVSMGLSSHLKGTGDTAKERTIRLTHKGRILTEGDRKRPKGKSDPERPNQLLGGEDLTKGGYLGDSRDERIMDGRNVARGVALNREVVRWQDLVVIQVFVVDAVGLVRVVRHGGRDLGGWFVATFIGGHDIELKLSDRWDRPI